MEWGMFAAIVGVIGLQTALLLWMMSKLDADIRATTADSNTKWMAVNGRVDITIKAINDRFDAISSRLDRIIDKLGK